jgi:hypothetical protein
MLRQRRPHLRPDVLVGFFVLFQTIGLDPQGETDALHDDSSLDASKIIHRSAHDKQRYACDRLRDDACFFDRAFGLQLPLVPGFFPGVGS